MITLHGEEVKVGDSVWDMHRGWGEVYGLDDENSIYPIYVQWEEDGDYEWFSKEGKEYIEEKTPTLFWQPIEFEIPKKPKPKKKEKVWQWIYFDSKTEKYRITNSRYSSVDDLYSKHDRARHKAVAPLQLSEIEREVKE